MNTRRRRPVLPAILAIACAVLIACTTRSPWMSFAEYADSAHPIPYVLRWKLGDATLIYFGSAHTYHPEDKQVVDIARLWSQLRPTLAFNEGGDPPALSDPAEAVARHGEAGLLRHLAARDDVPIRSIEQSFAAEVAGLRTRFSSEQIAVFYVARQLEQHHRRVTEDSAAVTLQRTLARLTALPGLTDAPRTPDALLGACVRLLPPPGDCLHPDPAWLDPADFDTGAFTNALARALSQQRDEHMVDVLREALSQPGARVFAVVGASHVFMQERALDQALASRRGRR